MLVTQILNSLNDYRVNLGRRVRIVAIGPLMHPFHHIEAVRSVQAELVAIEQIRNERQVPISSELVGHELTVGPDTDDIGEKEDGLAGVLSGLFGRRGDIGVVLAGDLDRLSGRMTSKIGQQLSLGNA